MIKLEKIEIWKSQNNELLKISSINSRIRVMFFQKEYKDDAVNVFGSWLQKVPSIYVLKGYENDKPTFYVGQTLNFVQRLKDINHPYKEEWVEQVIIICSKDQEHFFDTGELLYFERSLIKKLRENQNIILKNINEGQNNSNWSSEDKYMFNSELEIILNFIKMIKEDWFEQFNNDIKISDSIDSELRDEKNYMKVEHKFKDSEKIIALFNKVDNSIILEKNTSIFNYLKNKNISKRLKDAFAADKNLFKENDKTAKYLILNKDLSCSSVSSASVILTGSKSNGWDFWIMSENGKPLNQIRKK